MTDRLRRLFLAVAIAFAVLLGGCSDDEEAGPEGTADLTDAGGGDDTEVEDAEVPTDVETEGATGDVGGDADTDAADTDAAGGDLDVPDSLEAGPG